MQFAMLYAQYCNVINFAANLLAARQVQLDFISGKYLACHTSIELTTAGNGKKLPLYPNNSPF